MLRKVKKDEKNSKMKRAAVMIIHGGYWLLYLLLLAVIFAALETQNQKTSVNLKSLLPLLSICILPNLISFYTFYFPLFSRFLIRKKVFALVIVGTSVSFVSALSGAVISLVFFGFEQAIFANPNEFLSITITFTIIAAIHGGIALVIHGFINWYDEIKLKEELARKNFETEIALLKSQINPHFLFNTLNNIDILITRNAPLASEYLNKLSGILRYMVYETKAEKIALATELDYIKKYLELQKIRTTNENYVNFEVTGNADNLTVAPMIFSPFIENAFKHTENKKNSNSIRIKVLIEKDKIVFECENSYQKSTQKSDYGGLGNELIEKRLMLLYPNKYSLEIVDDQGIYRVNLMMKM